VRRRPRFQRKSLISSPGILNILFESIGTHRVSLHLGVELRGT
jgi:hypothetical protein